MGTTVTSGAIAAYRRSLSEKGRSENTKRAYVADCNDFLQWVSPGVPLDEITIEYDDFQLRAAEYLKYKDKKDRSKNTFRRRVTSIKGFARFLGNDQHLKEYKPDKPPKGVPHPLKEGMPGVFKLLEVAETTQQRALVALCGLLGARVSEAREIETFEINLEEKIVMLGGKHGKYRNVPISRAAMGEILPAYVDALTDGRTALITMCDTTARDTIKRLSKKAGLIGDPSSHDLRATFGTHMYNTTKDLRLVQDLLGHEDPKTTEVYIEVRMETLRTAVEIEDEDEKGPKR